MFTALDNKCHLNSFSFLIFKTLNITIPNNEIINMYFVYFWIKHVHSILCKVEKCSCLVTVPTYLTCWKARLVTNDFNSECLQIINKITIVTSNKIIATTTTIVTNNKIIAVTNMKISTVWLSKMKFFLAISKSLIVCISSKRKMLTLVQNLSYLHFYLKYYNIPYVCSNISIFVP